MGMQAIIYIFSAHARVKHATMYRGLEAELQGVDGASFLSELAGRDERVKRLREEGMHRCIINAFAAMECGEVLEATQVKRTHTGESRRYRKETERLDDPRLYPCFWYHTPHFVRDSRLQRRSITNYSWQIPVLLCKRKLLPEP